MVRDYLAYSLLAAAVVISFQTDQMVIDRTDLTSQTTRRGLPGESSWGRSSGETSRDLDVPLTVRCDGISASISGTGKLNTLVRLTNTGTSALALPVSLDGAKTHRDGTENRIGMAISVEVSKDGAAPSPSQRRLLEGFFGSDDFPESLVHLAPGKSIILRLAAASNGVGIHAGDTIYFFVDTFQLENSRFYIKSRSKIVSSSQAVLVTAQ